VTRSTRASGGIPASNKWAGSRDSAVVTSKSQAWRRLARHTDSAEEILYMVAGERAEIGDQRGRNAAGDLAVIPAMVPHGLVNVGNETVKVVGFSLSAEVISTFKEPMQPFGAAF
jgi:quercetin dioxygenase-like cupin family protein